MERGFGVKAVLLYIGVLLTLAALSLAKVYYIQSAQSEGLEERLGQMWERKLSRQAQRGCILARDGETVLAGNIKLARVVAELHLISKPQEVANGLSPFVGLSPEEIHSRITDDNAPRSLELAYDIPVEVAEQICDLRLRGVFIRYYFQRHYPYAADFAAQTVGYSCWKTGLQIGLEAVFDEQLVGTSGKDKFSTDRFGHIIPGTLKSKDPAHGSDLVSTLDAAIQQICEDVLSSRFSRYRAKWGLITVMDPRTGEILAVATRPTFNPNEYAREGSKGNEANPLVHYAFEPGSVMKPLVAAAALDRGWLSPQETFHCTPSLTIGKYTITEAEHDRNPAGFGDIPIHNIIVHSSNVGIAQVGLKLGQHRLSDIFSTFGLYECTGIELPNECGGIRPKGYEHAKKGEVWPDVAVANAAFGQGIAVTPLQLMRAYAVIANGGYLVRPTLVTQPEKTTKVADVGTLTVPLEDGESLVGDTDSGIAARLQVASDAYRIISETTAAEVRAVLQEVVRDGTGRKAALDNFSVAGKTGSAQVAGKGGYVKGKYVSSFIGFFPADEPKYLVLVTLAEPRGAYYASEIAAPAFHEVAERIAMAKEIPPERKHEAQ